MRHPSVPQGMTIENLAVWITDNCDKEQNFVHTEKTPLDEETTAELEHKSSLASRAIDRLEEVKKQFMDVLKDGTPDEESPFDVTIPPTKGTKILEANRKWADKQLEDGYSETLINIYFIPDTENSRMVAMDIEGQEYEQYSKDMSDEEQDKYGKLFAKEKKKGSKKSAPKEEAPLDL